MKIYRSSKLGLIGCMFLLLSMTSQDAWSQRRVKSKTVAPSGLMSATIAEAETAATSLGKSKSAKAVSTLLDALAIGVHPRVASAALDALAVQAKPVSFDTLAFYLKNRNTKVRIAALKAMSMLKTKKSKALTLAALRDGNKNVRATAAQIATEQNNMLAIEPLIKLLKKGDESSAIALSALANAKVASQIGLLFGEMPDKLLAACLGGILMRPDFNPEDARVEVVKTLGRIPGNESIEQLTNYLGSIPEKPPRESRAEAESIVDARLGGE